MSWQERPYADDPYGGGRRYPRLSENPLDWSLRVGRLFAIDIRVHILFLIYIITELLNMRQARDAVVGLGMLFGVVLLHEFGHCFAARFVGGSAREILLWPLGGLAMVHAPPVAAAQFIVAVGGPLVNVFFCMLTAPLLVIGGGSLMSVPWNPFGAITLLGTTPDWFPWAYRFFLVNYVLLLFNLLPMYPLDGGRILQAVLWSRIGLRRSTQAATSVGMIGAVCLGVFGMVRGDFILIAVAAFGYITCLMERRMVAAGLRDDEGEFGYVAYETPTARRRGPLAWWAAWRQRVRRRREARELERHRREMEAVDRILSKVHREGIQSLTRAERRALETATRRQRDMERMKR